jgi:hypothetical protein
LRANEQWAEKGLKVRRFLKKKKKERKKERKTYSKKASCFWTENDCRKLEKAEQGNERL